MKRAVVRTLFAALLLVGLSGLLSGGTASAALGCRNIGKGFVCYRLAVHNNSVVVFANQRTGVGAEVDPIPLYGAAVAVFTSPQALGAGFVCFNGRYVVLYGNPNAWTLRYTPVSCRA